jgi:hypothetical protein
MCNALADPQSRPEQNVGAVVAEVKVLQSLVERLYSARSACRSRRPRRRPPPRRPLCPSPLRRLHPQLTGRLVLAHAAGAEGLGEQEILDLVREGLRANAVELARSRSSACRSASAVSSNASRACAPRRRGDRRSSISRSRSATACDGDDNLLLFRCIQIPAAHPQGQRQRRLLLNISPNTLATAASSATSSS